MRKKWFRLIMYLLLICLLVSGPVIMIGCGGGDDSDDGSGEGGSGEEDGIPAELVGVWEMTSKYRYSSYEEACINESYPYTDSEGVVISIYLKMDAEGNAAKYVKFENMADFLIEEGYSDGLYHCNTADKTFSVSNGVITDNYSEASEYSVLEGILTIIPDDTVNGCVEQRQFEKVSESSIADAVENCDLAIDSYDDDDSFYQIFILGDPEEI